MKQMGMPPRNDEFINMCKEDFLKRGENSSRQCEYSDRIISRGINNNNTSNNRDHHYNNFHLSEYLLTPCPVNTWKNWVVEDKEKKCSKTHQFYMNITKRN
jgi:hypothetical protein